MTNTLDLSKFLYCRNCEIKTYHRKILKYDWGYGCTICDTWQHQSQLISIQQSYAAKAIIGAIGSEYISYCEGTLEEFIEAAQALDMEYDYQKTEDGYDFMAWHLDNEENAAKIHL
ncbi:hypothetical protein [Nostoc sp. MG11]|uniref:hypothetical protein n=1 Tax=Nostoc sp. MG11 TaxID=2721166 RepID=UPI001866EF7F|nr:hypothetical protein [Nostoc sp. MG11]